MKEWYYFGCGHGAGHYLFGEGLRFINSRGPLNPHVYKVMSTRFDGTLAPLLNPVRLYEAAMNVLPGIGFVAMAWHDQSEDKRSGSNSVLFAPIDPRCVLPSFEYMVEEGKKRFPYVFERLPQPLTRWAPLI